MKFIHLSDLHLGKRVNEFSMLEDQEYILKEILAVADREAPDAVLISGDVYDKSVPSAEAVTLFDDFLVNLVTRHLQVFVISGNHDSAERIAFASRILDAGGVHMSPVYSGTVEPVTLRDGYGDVNVFMLPFIKPVHVRRFPGAEEVVSYTDAVKWAVDRMGIDREERNVLLTHQFVTGAVRSDSEETSVGGSDNVDARVFDGFDYVALGHLHIPQDCGAEHIRYCGSPLKYSFSEIRDRKSVTIVEMAEKGSVAVRTEELVPLHDMVELKGTYSELTFRPFYEDTSWQEDYVHAILTDEEDVPDAMARLRAVYHNLMKLDYDNRRTRAGETPVEAVAVETKSPLELFGDLYEKQNGQGMTEEQTVYMKKLIEETWEAEA